MVVNQWFIDSRNKLASICGEFDSCAAIEGARLSDKERESYRKALAKIVEKMDKQIFK